MEESDRETGFISWDAEKIDSMLTDIGISIEKLSQENMDADEQALFYFVMYNQKPAELVKTGDSNSYLTNLVYNDEMFYVLFGSDEVDAEEIGVFCQEGTTIEYWARGYKQNDVYMLIPMIAGNEENGYYIVRPTLMSTGIDLSDMMSLTEQGVDFTTQEASEIEDDTVVTELTGEEIINIEFTGAETDEGTMKIDYEMRSTFPMDVYLYDATYTLNGEDVTDYVSAFFAVDANETIEDSFFIEGYSLQAGDEFIISGMLTDDETLEDIGEIEFVFKID